MKIQLPKNEFLEKLELSSRFTSSKLSSSISLQGVCLIGEEKNIHFYSTDLNYYYHSILKNENNSKFKIIIEPKRDFIFIGFMIHSNLITKEGQIRVPLATLPRDYIKA